MARCANVGMGTTRDVERVRFIRARDAVLYLLFIPDMHYRPVAFPGVVDCGGIHRVRFISWLLIADLPSRGRTEDKGCRVTRNVNPAR